MAVQHQDLRRERAVRSSPIRREHCYTAAGRTLSSGHRSLWFVFCFVFPTLILTGPGLNHDSILDEGSSGAGLFLAEFGMVTLSQNAPETPPPSVDLPKLFRLSDATDGALSFEPVHPPLYSTLSSADAFLLDDTQSASPTVYVWLGREASLNERRLAVQYAQNYLYSRQSQAAQGRIRVASNIVKMVEGRESEAFLRIIGR